MAVPAPKKQKYSASSSSRIETYDVDSDASEGSSEGEDDANLKPEAARPKTLPEDHPHNRFKRPHNRSSNGTYGSSIFSLQIDELLSRVRPDYERRMVKVENALRKLKAIIERTPSREAKTLSEVEREQSHHNVQIPFPMPQPQKEAKNTFAYSKPANINVVGSYARRTALLLGDQMTIDFAVTMPSEIFQSKDYLNYRYFHKRAFYLACIATAIKEAEESSFTMEFALQNGNELQPVIIVNPGQGNDDFSKSRCKIRIILASNHELFPISKTLPNKNAIRTRSGINYSEDLPTPFYNASIRSECSSLTYLKYLHKASVQSENFADACILGGVWLRQRGLGRGGFGSFEWACTVALLMQGGGHGGRPVLSKAYSSYQIFKATVQYLAVKDLMASPTLVHSHETSIARSGYPIFFDGATGLNVLFKMTPWSYELLRHEAKLTSKMLDSLCSNQFDSCFITKLDKGLSRFDYIVRLPIVQLASPKEQTADANSISHIHYRKIYQVLRTALGDRSLLIHLSGPSELAWSPTLQKPMKVSETYIEIGILLDPEHVNRTVDRGPSAEDKGASSAFRGFWGEKAELRRYKDGSIQESLIWSSSDYSENMLQQIITYTIQRHLGLEQFRGMKTLGASFDRILPTQKRVSLDPIAEYQPIVNAYEKLEKDVSSLEGLPLRIRQISPADPQLRYASVNVPVLDPLQSTMDPASICVQFEGSSRWPDDLFAVQRTKVAFLLKIGELLEESNASLTARVGLESKASHLVNAAFLDISYPSGALFRLRIHHEREVNLLERSRKGYALTAASKEEIALAAAAYKQNFIQAPLHTQAVRTLSTRFPLLSPSMRLLKYWRNSHLLSGHISDELIELLTIRTFVDPYPWSVPGSTMTGFLRTLMFIAKWDWRSEPLIVDFNGELNGQDIEAIRVRFEAWRKIDPAMNRTAMFAASNIDQHGVTWTESGPSKVVATRFTNLARAACNLVNAQGISIEPRTLFAASLEDYDFVIYLNPMFVSGSQKAKFKTQPVFKNLQIHASQDTSILGSDPVESYLKDLRTLHGNNVIFFYNEQGGSLIAGLWNPHTGPRPWKVNIQYSTIPLSRSEYGETEPQLSINKSAILHDISRLGDDLISRIHVNKKHA